LSGFFSLLVYESVLGQSHLLVGASGAVFGLLLAFATYFPTATLLIFGIIPVRAPVLAVGYMALEVVNIITRVGGNVAHLTHLAGAVFAFVYLVVRLRINPIREFRDGGRY
jgi:membrane associated rhomboid family serine protease